MIGIFQEGIWWTAVMREGGGGHGLALGHIGDDLHQEQGPAGADHIHGDTGQDDVGLQVEGEEAHEQSLQHAHHQSHQ